MTLKTLLILTSVFMLSGCDMLLETLEIPNPAKEQAQLVTEGKAVGSACRHAGRSLEDCYLLNPESPKSAIFAGWREMNDYMLANGLEVVPSQLTADRLPALSLPDNIISEGSSAPSPKPTN